MRVMQSDCLGYGCCCGGRIEEIIIFIIYYHHHLLPNRGFWFFSFVGEFWWCLYFVWGRRFAESENVVKIVCVCVCG